MKRRSFIKGLLFAAMMPVAVALNTPKIKETFERFRITNAAEGELTYIGNEDFHGTLTLSINMAKKSVSKVVIEEGGSVQ